MAFDEIHSPFLKSPHFSSLASAPCCDDSLHVLHSCIISCRNACCSHLSCYRLLSVLSINKPLLLSFFAFSLFSISCRRSPRSHPSSLHWQFQHPSSSSVFTSSGSLLLFSTSFCVSFEHAHQGCCLLYIDSQQAHFKSAQRPPLPSTRQAHRG